MIHFSGNSLQATRSLAGFYLRSLAGVRQRALGVVLNFQDAMRQYRFGAHGSVLQPPPGYINAFEPVLGVPDGSHQDSWRYNIFVTLDRQPKVEINVGAFIGGLDFTRYIYAGPQVLWRSVANSTLNRRLDSSINFKSKQFYRCFGQVNPVWAEYNYGPLDQSYVLGPDGYFFVQGLYPTENDDTINPAVEFAFIAPVGVAPNVWISGGDELLEATPPGGRPELVQLNNGFEAHCLMTELFGDTLYRADEIVSRKWGEGYYPGTGRNLLFSYPANSPSTSAQVTVWKLRAWVKEIVPRATYNLQFQTDTPGVACLGGTASIETIMPITRGPF